MSQIRTAIRIPAGKSQYDAATTSPGSHNSHAFIPLNPDGSAVQVSSVAPSTPAASTTLRADAVLTASYVGGTAVDMTAAGSITLGFTVGTTNSETVSFKPQWSMNNSSWFDEQVLAAGSPSSTETPLTATAGVRQFSAATAGTIYVERFNRLARYFRCALKSTGTTATVSSAYQLS